MNGFLAQAVSDIGAVQAVSQRLDLVGVLVLNIVGLVWALKTKFFVIGWVFEANQKRLMEAEALRDRLIEVQMSQIEAARTRRDA